METKTKVMIGVVAGIFVLAITVLVFALIYGPGQQTTLLGICIQEGWADSTDEVEVDGAQQCSTPDWDTGFPLTVSYSAYADVGQDVEAAVEAINTAMGQEVLVVGEGATQIEVVTNAPYESGIRGAGGDAAFLMEHGSVTRCVVHTRATGNAGVAHDVLQHELLHCLLLAHDVEDEGSIMHDIQQATWDLRNRKRLRDTDRDALRQHHGL